MERRFRTIRYKDEGPVEEASTEQTVGEKDVYSPLKGKMILLGEVEDEVFSSGALGQGVAVIPEAPEVYAPVDGEVVMVADTKHAVGFTSNDGVEVMIHMGLDTVKLEGKYFDIKVKQGDKVKRGDLIAIVDFQKIKEAGYPVVTPVLILNSDSFTEVKEEIPKLVTEKDRLLVCRS